MMNTYNLPTPAAVQHPGADAARMRARAQLPGGAGRASRRRCRASASNLYFSGYGEGWGLYSEWLGNEMGIYRTPYERFGQQSYAMWRAARLVIDTGIHRYGWSRQQAIDYLAGAHRAVAARGRDRGRPLHQLAGPGRFYKLGQLTIRKLRAEAEAELGRVRHRAFHDTFLAWARCR